MTKPKTDKKTISKVYTKYRLKDGEFTICVKVSKNSITLSNFWGTKFMFVHSDRDKARRVVELMRKATLIKVEGEGD